MSRHKTQFKTIKKRTNKTSDLTEKFKKNLQEQLDSDDDDGDQQNEQKSKHESLVNEYLAFTQLEQALTTGLRAAISGDLVPKNPWCEVSRTLGVQNLKTDIYTTFEKLAKNFRKTPCIETRKYHIYKISYSFKQKTRIINSQNELEEVLEEQKFEVYGYERMLEYVFLPNLKEFYFAIQNILPSFIKEYPQGRIQVVNSLSGGYIIKSGLITYPKAHPKDLEINCECFIQASSDEIAFDMFANFVFEDCQSINNKQDLNLIKVFLIYFFDQEKKEQKKITWKMKNISNSNKNRFINEIKEYTKSRSSIYWKGYCRVKGFENLDLMEGIDENNPEGFQYIEVYKIYNLHLFKNDGQQIQKISYQNQPLGSLLKGVFFDEGQAQIYASFFYKDNETFNKSIYYKDFVKNHLMLVLKKWEEQNIGASAWELFYLALYIENADQRRDLLDSIIQIISSDYSSLIQLTKLNNILQMLMEEYDKKQQALLRPIITSTYNVYRQELMVTFGRSSGSDIIRYREFLFRLLREMEDRQGGFLIEENSYQVLKAMVKVTKFIGIGNLQRVGAITVSLSLYIFDSLKQNKLISENSGYYTYEEFQSLKAPKKMLHVSTEIQAKKIDKEFKYKKEGDIEDVIILQFLNEYDLFDNLYYILRDIFFGKQLPNALPTAQFKVETKAIKYQLFEIERKEVYDQMINQLSEDKRINYGNDPSMELYNFITEDMDDLDLKPIIGWKQCLYYAAVFEISGLKAYLDEFPWRKALKRPIPEAYKVMPILAVSGTYLFHDADVINRTYGEWGLHWDWIIKGASYPHAQQIFIDTILKYVSWLEVSTEMMVMGFFTKKNRIEPFLTIEEILKAEDLSEIRQRLLSKFTEGKAVFFKTIFKVETRFKNVNFIINLHYIDQSGSNLQSLLQEDICEHYFRVFFDLSEFKLWNRLYPYSNNRALKLLTQQQQNVFYTGSLNDAIKLELIKFFVTESEEIFLTMCRILFSYSESFYNYSKEAETFYFLFKYLNEIKNKERPKIESANDIKDYYSEWQKGLQDDLIAYDNIYFDSIGATVMNYLQHGTQAFENNETDFDSYASKMIKLYDMCQIISDSVVLTYRQLLLEDYGYTLLWLPKQR
ncbi:unnamed protein product [Paramecium sonneborni]|uniref:Uncharacterized protein n=1 Tax=Paramecium sonneborni TaxID=65129 RepID=A0A8S1PAN5_9CILI|nr:unnamed protein product [Paramecium sonneborni]